MHNDNALWYDYVGLDVAPSRTLLFVANVFEVIVCSVKVVDRIYQLPNRIWCWVADMLAQHRESQT